LTAKQFKGDLYAVQSDDEDDGHSEQFLMAGGLGEKGGNEGDGESELSNPGDLEDDVAEILRSAATGDRTETKQAIVGKGEEAPILKSNIGPNRGRVSGVKTQEKAERVNGGREARATRKAVSRTHPPTTARRLPVNELFLVASPPDYTQIDPATTYQGVETQDPIDSSSSSPRKRPMSPVDSEREANDRRAVKTPLTEIRKRIQIPRWRYKRLTMPQQTRDETVQKVMRNDFIEFRGRDGFEASELTVRNRPTLRRKPKIQTPLISKFDALQLCSGPLPNVEFESPLKHERQTQVDTGNGIPVYGANNERDRILPPKASRSSSRRVSFIDRAREDRIRAELSSISAPARVRSESEDSDMDVEDDEHMQDEDENEDACGSDHASNEDDQAVNVEENGIGHEANLGVTMDFRRPELLPRAKITQSFQRRNLMEVNEKIVEVPDTSPTRRYSNRPSEQSTASQKRPRRLPSILKNSTPMFPDSTSRPEHTQANTRRNSFVQIEESRYFAGAADALRDLDPARHKIIHRRPSYFDFGEVHVPDSDHVVPETSPDRLQYTSNAQLSILRRTSEAVWTSSTDTNMARDLKTLTRSVSREHGTLSQSVRRRPSVPFQSPKKVL
jgi:hypothetical protein